MRAYVSFVFGLRRRFVILVLMIPVAFFCSRMNALQS